MARVSLLKPLKIPHCEFYMSYGILSGRNDRLLGATSQSAVIANEGTVGFQFARHQNGVKQSPASVQEAALLQKN